VLCCCIFIATPLFSIASNEGFKLMKDVRVDKTMVNGKAVFKTININKSASQDDVPLVPGGKLLDLGIDVATWEPFFDYLSEHCACKSQRH
jgi:hypothetical protein